MRARSRSIGAAPSRSRLGRTGLWCLSRGSRPRPFYCEWLLAAWCWGSALALTGTARAENWPQWRGPRGDGTSFETNLPRHWSATSNVLWQARLPGSGHGSPIVWGDRVFTVTAVADTEERVLLSYDRSTGRLVWQQTVVRSPFERKHLLNSQASGTPATDGELVFTAFLDVNQMVVAAHDFAGQQRWLVRPGKFSSVHGFCTSPVVYADKVIVNGDHDGDGYVAALARTDGRELWRIERPNKTRSYCTPTIFQAAGRRQMVMSGSLSVAGYDPDSGNPLWIIDGPTEQFVASVVYNARANLFFVTGGYPEHHLLGVRPDGAGNITATHVAWRHNRASYVAYVPSPVAVDDFFFVISDTGQACCFDAATGELRWQERLGEHHASLVAAKGLVYFLSDDGVTTVVRAGPRFEVLSRNELGERCFASPALSGGRVYIRGDRHLFCLEEKS